MIEPGAFLQALKEVDDGAEPEDVYAKYMSEAEPYGEDWEPDVDPDDVHTQGCKEKFDSLGYCPEVFCVTIPKVGRAYHECDCTCHGFDDD